MKANCEIIYKLWLKYKKYLVLQALYYNNCLLIYELYRKIKELLYLQDLRSL